MFWITRRLGTSRIIIIIASDSLNKLSQTGLTCVKDMLWYNYHLKEQIIKLLHNYAIYAYLHSKGRLSVVLNSINT